MLNEVRITAWSLALLVFLPVTVGCGGSSFVGRRFDNFTAYYNTFYNAEKAYEEGVKALERGEEAVDRRFYMSVFSHPTRSSNDQTFQDVIDKCADVLRRHPDSKWVDDALLLIGKSYFYQQNFVGAEQKFSEVIALGSALEDQARLWLARTLVAAGSYPEAREHLTASLSRDDLSDRWAPQLHLALGELHVKEESFEEGAEELELGLEKVRDNDLEARGRFLLGQVLETLGRYEDAVEAYERVREAHPRYELLYAASYSAERVRGLYLDADEALTELRRMARDDKNYSNRFELAFLRGRIYQAGGQIDAAKDTYRSVLYDPEAQLGDLRGRIHYALGELYRIAEHDYLTASAHFDTARTALSLPVQSRGEVPVQHAPEAIVDAQRRAEMFASFSAVRRDIARMDSLLTLGRLDPEEFAGRVLEIRQQRARELIEEQRRAERLQAERGFQDAAARTPGGASTPSRNEATGQAGFLFHRDPVRVQEARLEFIARWGERPYMPNWRRSAAVAAAASDSDRTADDVAGGVRDVDPNVSENPLPPLDYSDVPRDSVSRAAMEAARALARYELGNVLFLSMDRPDSAAAWYRMVIEEDRDQEVAQRAFYALAEVHRSMGDSAAARDLYERVVRDYPQSDFAGRVREHLGIREDVPRDSLALAFQAYEEAAERWRRGFYSEGLDRMITVAARHKQTEVAPKALLAAGRIFMEWAARDSLDVFGPLPLSVPDSVLEEAGLLGLEEAYGGGAPDEPTPPEVIGEPQPVAEPNAAAPGGASEGVTLDAPRRRIESGQEVEALAENAAPSLSAEDAPAPDTAFSADGAVASGQPYSAEDPGRLDTTQTVGSGAVVDAGDAAGNAVGVDTSRTTENTADVDTENTAGVDTDQTSMETTAVVDTARTTGSAGAVNVEIAAGEAGATDSEIASGDEAIVDTMATGGNTVAVGALQTTGDATAADSGAIYLKTLYAGVQQHYSATEYAAQAGRMLNVLESRYRALQAAADSAAYAARRDVDLAAVDTAAAPAGRGLTSAADVRADAPAAVDTPADSVSPPADSAKAWADSANARADAVRAPADSARMVDVPADSISVANASGDSALAANAPPYSTANGRLDSTARAVTDSTMDALSDPALGDQAGSGMSAGADPAVGAGADSSLGARADSRVSAGADSALGARADSGAGAGADSSLGARADSGAGAGADSAVNAPAASGANVSADSAAGAGGALAQDAQALSEIPSGQTSLRGEGGVQKDLGGYTLVVGTDVKREPMEDLAEKYAARGFRTDVLEAEVGSTTIFRAVLGHFANAQDAGQAVNMLQSTIEEGLQIASLRNFK